jgi:hypothetical protein
MKAQDFLLLEVVPSRFKLVYGSYPTRIHIRVDSESACSEIPMIQTWRDR